jgi:hypothetical protein
MRPKPDALFEGVKTVEEFRARILNRQVARHPELAQAPDREAAAWRILAETAFSEYLKALGAVAALSQPSSAVPDDQDGLPVEAPDTVEGDCVVPLAAQVLTDRAVKASGEASRAQSADYLKRADERLANILLEQYEDFDGYGVLMAGGPKGFDPAAYFEERLRVAKALLKKRQGNKRRAAAETPEGATLRRAKDNVRSAKVRLKKRQAALANAEKAQAEAEERQDHALLMRNRLPHGPLAAAREALTNAERQLAKAVEAARAAESGASGR